MMIEQLSPSSHYFVEARSDIGERNQQQDYAYLHINSDRIFAVVCDGMGGACDGELASQTAVSAISRAYTDYSPENSSDIPAFLYRTMVAADAAVSTRMTHGVGGTTLVSAIISGTQMYWVSVGDSRLYIIRSGEMIQATRDHNYFLRLREMLERGQLTSDLYEKESKRGEALISYLGMGGISLYDLTQSAFELQHGDTILITTDGLPKALSNEALYTIITSECSTPEKADMLIRQARDARATISQDNTTFIVVDVI